MTHVFDALIGVISGKTCTLKMKTFQSLAAKDFPHSAGGWKRSSWVQFHFEIIVLLTALEVCKCLILIWILWLRRPFEFS